MSNLKEELTNLYPNETLPDAEVQSMSDGLTRFFTLCLQIAGQEESLQEVQGNQQNNVQNVDNLR